jgi:hypothetical protein
MLGFAPDRTRQMANCSSWVKPLGAWLGFLVDGFPVGVFLGGVFFLATENLSELLKMFALGDFVVGFDILAGFALLTSLAIDVFVIDVFLGVGVFEVFS